jgi:hypothetical protein
METKRTVKPWQHLINKIFMMYLSQWHESPHAMSIPELFRISLGSLTISPRCFPKYLY